MPNPPTPLPIVDDPVSFVLTNRDLVHEIAVRVHCGQPWPARERGQLRGIGAAWADAADRLPVTVDAREPATWALARHGTHADVRAALRGAVSLSGGGRCRASTLAASRLLRSGAPPSLSSVTAAHLTSAWLARALEGRDSPLAVLEAAGFWHRPAAAARLPACGAAALTLTQAPGGGVGAGKAALLPAPGLLARVRSLRALTLVGLAGAVLDAAPADLSEVALERVPVCVVGGGPASPPVALPPGHGRLARLSVGFAAVDADAGPAASRRAAVADVAALGGGADALELSAPGRALRVLVPARFLPAGVAAVGVGVGGADAATAIASALRTALVASGVGSVAIAGGKGGGGGGGWEVAVVEGVGEEEGVAVVGVLPGAAVAAAGVGSATPGGGWAWHAGRR